MKKQAPAQPSDSEWLTRKRLIDSALKASGWKVVPFAQGKLSAQNRCAIEEYPTSAGPADYALCVHGQIIGIVEAKKLTLGLRTSSLRQNGIRRVKTKRTQL